MKINPGFRPVGKEITRLDTAGASQVKTQSFSDMMQQQDKQATTEELQQRMEQIHRQGERLAKSMTVRELRGYKLLVKKFLEDTVKRGIGLKETRGWDRRGRGKRYKLLDEIDRSLVEMADELLESEQGKIQLLEKIGEIRGMLINLLF